MGKCTPLQLPEFKKQRGSVGREHQKAALASTGVLNSVYVCVHRRYSATFQVRDWFLAPRSVPFLRQGKRKGAAGLKLI